MTSVAYDWTVWNKAGVTALITVIDEKEKIPRNECCILTLAIMMAIPCFSLVSERKSCFPVFMKVAQIYPLFICQRSYFSWFYIIGKSPLYTHFNQVHKLNIDKTHFEYQLYDPIFSRVLLIFIALINTSNDSGTIHFNRHNSLFLQNQV